VEAAEAPGGSFKLVTPVTAQGNTKGWRHTNKLKQYKHTKYKANILMILFKI